MYKYFENMDPEKKMKLKRGLRIGLIVFIAVCFANLLTANYDEQDNKQINTISFTGHGEVQAVPDIANISFTIRKEGKSVKIAQDEVVKVEEKVLEMLKNNNIEDRDIKTVNISFNPKYEYRYQYEENGKIVPCAISSYRPCPGKNVIVGYEAYENINTKIRNIDNAGKLVEELGSLGVTDLYGPNFSIDDEDSLKDTARREAIKDAKIKAKTLAKDLGVRLVKITSFSESGNYPVPMYSKMSNDTIMGTGESSSRLELSKGENTISSDVTITYEIR